MDDPARDDLLARIDSAWRAFRDGVELARQGGLGRTMPAGWTARGMVAHVAAWHDATAYRLYRFGETGHQQPKVEPDEVGAVQVRMRMVPRSGGSPTIAPWPTDRSRC